MLQSSALGSARSLPRRYARVFAVVLAARFQVSRPPVPDREFLHGRGNYLLRQRRFFAASLQAGQQNSS